MALPTATTAIWSAKPGDRLDWRSAEPQATTPLSPLPTFSRHRILKLFAHRSDRLSEVHHDSVGIGARFEHHGWDLLMNNLDESATWVPPQTASTVEPRGRYDPGWWVGLWFFALISVATALRLIDPTGWLGSDDSAYYNAAEQVLSGQTMTRVHHHNARMAVILPIAASIRLLGASPFTIVLPTFIASLLCVSLVAVLGRMLWGWWEGLLAATVVAFLPYFHVLSMVAYPDVHACLWSTLALVLGVAGLRADRWSWRITAGIGCGIAVGMAASAKLFALGVLVPIGYATLRVSNMTRWGRVSVTSCIALGGGVFLVAHGLFYLRVADDFWYKLHAVHSVQGATTFFPHQGYFGAASLSQLVYDRLTYLFHVRLSGWGLLGALFWPVLLTACFEGRTGRMLVSWALATFLLVAFVPAGAGDHYQPPPIFDGRNILTATIPFALCLGWLLRSLLSASLGRAWLPRVWPGLAAALLAVSFYNPRELHEFRWRRTQRLAQAVTQVVERTAWDDHRPIFMPASFYLRYRVLFPERLRDRLRVAVDEYALDWWRDAAVDIDKRCETLAPPGDAYLLVTPNQLLGRAESFDYGVFLPREPLVAWRRMKPQLCIVRLTSGDVVPQQAEAKEVEPLLWLLPDAALERNRKKHDQRTRVDLHESPSKTG